VDCHDFIANMVSLLNNYTADDSRIPNDPKNKNCSNPVFSHLSQALLKTIPSRARSLQPAHDFLRPGIGQAHPVNTHALDVIEKLTFRIQLTPYIQHLVVAPRFCKSKETFILNIAVDQRGDVHERAVNRMDVPLRTNGSCPKVKLFAFPCSTSPTDG